jgi:acetyltransferase-like isoleucine patch superfamily enzyme
MAKKYGVASDYIKYTSRIKSDTSDGVAVEASQVVDLEEDKLQSDINKELKASIASASGNTYSKSEIDGKDTATLTSAKSYADTKKTEAVSAAATDATTKANSALASAKSYADQKVSALGSVYTTKGSCTAAQLKALTSAKAGDVWNITDAITIDGKAYPAGVNVVCVTAFSAAIDPAATKNWDALQGLQDLTSYAKWSQVEEAAISDVEFERDVAGEDNSYTFKKTLTYVGGTKREVDFGIILDPATSTKAGVMSAADKVKLDAVDGRIQGVKIYESSTDGFIIQNADYDNLKATIGTDVHIESAVNIRTGANIGVNAVLSNNAQIKRNVLIYEEVEIGNNATIGKDTIGTNLIQIRNNYAGKIAIGNGVQIAQGVGISVDDDCNLVFGREIQGSYQMKTAATTDALSDLETRVSALEDLLKLA